MFERLPDFIQAFMLKQPGGVAGSQDLRASIALQNAMISVIDAPLPEGDIEPGELAIPSKEFWSECRSGLLDCSELAARLSVSPQLVVTQGDAPRPKRQGFGDSVMTSELLPYLLVRIEDRMLPIAPRNMVATVIAFWERRDGRTTGVVERDTAATAARFLRQRLSHDDCFAGPFRLSLSRPRRGHLEVAGLLLSDATLWIVAVVDRRRVGELPALERRLAEQFVQDGGLVVHDKAKGQMIRIQARHTSTATVRMLVVFAEGDTGASALRLRPSPSKKMFLPDFVSLIESTKDSTEIGAYFDFVDANRATTHSPFTGPVDLLAAFKQSHAMLVDGAFEPSFITLDPHWGSNWRYQQLTEFWTAAPHNFPDDTPGSWRLDSNSEGARRLLYKPGRRMAWSTDISAESTTHFLLDIDRQPLDVQDGRVLELLVSCIADSLAQRLDHVPTNVLAWKRIVTRFSADEDRLPSEVGFEFPSDDRSLLSTCDVTSNTHETLELEMTVDLLQVATGLQDAQDATFEARCVIEWLRGIEATTGTHIDANVIQAIEATGSKRPRFTFRMKERRVDVPDYPRPTLPTLPQYKSARRDLAIVFKDLGIEPGRYELAAAKSAIDRVRDAYRTIVHRKITGFSRLPVLLFGIEGFDELIADYDRETEQVRMSLSHDVDYDRHERLMKVHEDFLKSTKDYRYLIELALSAAEDGEMMPTSEDMASALAYINWLLVLYHASDTLHNDVDVGGIELDSQYVPDVFYSEFDDTPLQREYAQERLQSDRTGDVTSPLSAVETEQLDKAFLADTGFTLTTLLQVLLCLSRWPSLSSVSELQLRWSYRSDFSQLVETIVSSVEGVDRSQIEAAIRFLTLDAGRIRVLAGRDRVEADVPVWEHTKRDHRYTIRPLVALSNGHLTWGAAASARAFAIWNGTFSDGYPPADFAWPRVNESAMLVKRRIEEELEVKAYAIGRRHATCVEHGIDFRSRFPNEGFSDVGDFDVLAFVPGRNIWVTMECKYNKPPFALKDARRLREHIFGKTGDGGQLAKIERRSRFLRDNHEKLRELLGWPDGTSPPPTFLDLYICPRIFYWMRRPPRQVSVEFVRLGMLDEFLADIVGEAQ